MIQLAQSHGTVRPARILNVTSSKSWDPTPPTSMIGMRATRPWTPASRCNTVHAVQLSYYPLHPYRDEVQSDGRQRPDILQCVSPASLHWIRVKPALDASRLASINDLYHVEIVQAIEKLQKRCIVRFTEADMHIICASDVNEGGMQVWS